MEKFCPNCGKELVDGKCPECKKEKKNSKTSYSENDVINRQDLKKAAREKIKGNLWNIWKALLVPAAVGFVLGILGAILGEDSTIYSFISFIFEVALIPISAGIILYILNFERGKSFDIKDLFTYYDKRMLGLILLEVVIGLFTILWTILFIIPGIIAAISYSMSLYIWVDETKTDTLDVIKESKRMMKGYKWDFFVFQLSFIGWYLLVGITFGIAAIYVVPYNTLAQAMYYDELKAIRG